MSKYIDRFNKSGRSIANDIFFGVENGTISLEATEISDGRRLDHYAEKYYGNGLNWWIIASASGIRWHLGIGQGNGNRDTEEGIVLYIPSMKDILSLKER